MDLDDLLEALQKAKAAGVPGDTRITAATGKVVGATYTQSTFRLDIIDMSWVGPEDPYFE